MYPRIKILLLFIVSCRQLSAQELSVTSVIDSVPWLNDMVKNYVFEDNEWDLFKIKHDTNNKNKFKTFMPKLSIYNELIWFSGDSTLLTGKGVYNLLTISGGIDLMGIPFELNVTPVLKNGQYDKNLSTISFSFDRNTKLLNDKKQWINSKVDMMKNSFNKADLEELVNRFDYERLQKLTNSKNFALDKKQLTELLEYCKNDSVITHLDSVYLAEKEILLQKYQEVDSIYNRICIMQRTITERSVYLKDSVSSVIQAYSDEWDSANIPSQWVEKLKKAGISSGFLRKCMLIQNVDIGNYCIEGTPFTIKDTPYNGLYIAAQPNKQEYRIAYGKQLALNNFITTIQPESQYSGVEMLYSGFVRKDEQGSRIMANLIRFIKKPTAEEPAYNINNDILSISSDQYLSKIFKMTSELAYAHTALTPGNVTTDYNGLFNFSWDKMAADLKLEISPEKLPFKISGGISHIGSKYFTFGNPYLLLNRNAINTSFEANIFKKRLRINVGLSKTVSTNDTLSTVPMRQLLWNADVRYGFKSGAFIAFKYAPFSILQGSAQTDILSNTANIYLAQSVLPHKILKKEAQLLIMGSNFNNNLMYGDTLQISNAWFTSLNEQVLINENWQASISGNLGYNIDKFSWEQTYTVNSTLIKSDKSLALGLHMHKSSVGTWRPGVNIAIKTPILKKGEVGLFFLYRTEMKNVFKNNELFGNVTVRYVIF